MAQNTRMDAFEAFEGLPLEKPPALAHKAEDNEFLP
jgi:hypothetical protein